MKVSHVQSISAHSAGFMKSSKHEADKNDEQVKFFRQVWGMKCKICHAIKCVKPKGRDRKENDMTSKILIDTNKGHFLFSFLGGGKKCRLAKRKSFFTFTFWTELKEKKVLSVLVFFEKRPSHNSLNY